MAGLLIMDLNILSADLLLFLELPDIDILVKTMSYYMG